MNSQKKKLKILQVGWGWPPRQTGGAIYYTRTLCNKLSDMGHDVSYFYSGDQNLIPFTYIRRNKEKKIKLFEMVNSPNQYETKYNDSQNELQNHIMERCFKKVLKEVSPDIVHFQNFAGICASLVKVASDSGSVVINSMHNYIPICPIGEMFNYETNKICDLNSCTNCYKNKLITNRYINTIIVLVAKVASPRIKDVVRKLSFFRQDKPLVKVPANKVNSYEKEKNKRLSYFKDMLNLADMNLAVSKIVRDIYINYLRIDSGKVIVCHVGNEEAEKIQPESDLVHSDSVHKDGETTKFVFLGSLAPHKGFQNLLKAFKLIDQSKATLFVYAPISKEYEQIQSTLEKRYSIKFMGGYKLDELSKILSRCDVGIVPPVWHDNAPRVVFEMQSAGLPIIASNVGGMSDFVLDQKNGLIFQYDDPSDLAAKLNIFISEHYLIEEYGRNIIPGKTVSQHVAEIEAIYYDFRVRKLKFKQNN